VEKFGLFEPVWLNYGRIRLEPLNLVGNHAIGRDCQRC